MRIIFLLLFLFIGSSTAQSAEQDVEPEKKPVNPYALILETKDKFKLHADFYLGAKDKGGVLLLPGCSADRKMYQQLTDMLRQQKLHVLNLDLRGYGESMSDKFSAVQLIKRAKNMVAYQNAMTFLTSFWPKDIEQAFDYLRERVAKGKQVAVVSSDCSVKQGITLADQVHINSLVMIAPELDYLDKENYKNLNDIKSYFIASTATPESYKTSQELFEWNGANASKLQVFNDNRSAASLLRRYRALANDISAWLSDNLR